MSEQVLRVLLQLVDQLSGPAAQGAGGLHNVETAAKKTGEAVEKTEKKAKSAGDALKKMFSLEKLIQGVKMLVGEFQESIARLAEAGDKDAQRLQDSLGRAQGNMQRAQDNIAKGLAPTLDEAADSFNQLTEKTSSFSQILAILDPRNSIEDLQEMGRAAAETAELMGGLGRGVGELLAATGPAEDIQGDLAKAERDAGLAARTAALDHDALRKSLDDERKAAEDARLAMLDGQLAIAEFGRTMDETLSEAAEENIQPTVDTVQDLVTGLFDAALNAEELGKAVPLSQVEDLKLRSGDLTALLAQMDVPPEVKAALLAYLDLINEKLAAAESRARNAAAAMAAAPVPGGGPPSMGGGGGAGPSGEQINLQSGGTISEPIVGRGLHTGRRYNLGEGGTVEDVVPRGSGGPQIIQLVVDGRVLAEVVAQATERYRS